MVGGASGVNPGGSQFNGFTGYIVCDPSDFEEWESTFYPDVLAISGFGFHRTQGFSGLMNEDSELVLVKIVERVRQAFIESIEVRKQFLRQDDQFVDHRSFF